MLTNPKTPLKNTRKLIKKYGGKLINNTITNNELKELAATKNFQIPDHQIQTLMIDFVTTIAPLLTQTQLHTITSQMIDVDLKQCRKGEFWRNSCLSKYFAAYEIIISTFQKNNTLPSPSQQINQLPDELKDHLIRHFDKKKITRYFLGDTTSSCYNNLSNVLTISMMFINAVDSMIEKLKGESSTGFKRLSRKCNSINMQDINTGAKLQKCLRSQTKLDLSDKLISKPQKIDSYFTEDFKTKYDTKIIADTEDFKEFKKRIKTIRKRSTYSDLLKAHGIAIIVEAIEGNYSIEKIQNFITQYEAYIIKNTGSGLYSFFNCGCCGGYKSSSHKLLNKIENNLTLDNLELLAESESLLPSLKM